LLDGQNEGGKKGKRQSWLGLNVEETGRRGMRSEISAQDAGM